MNVNCIVTMGLVPEIKYLVSCILYQFNSYVYLRHKKSIYNKIYTQLDKIYIRIYNNAILDWLALHLKIGSVYI